LASDGNPSRRGEQQACGGSAARSRAPDLAAHGAGDSLRRAELARLGHVTTARVSQIMNLTLLSPAIQEQLFLPRIGSGPDLIKESAVVAREWTWDADNLCLTSRLFGQSRAIPTCGRRWTQAAIAFLHD